MNKLAENSFHVNCRLYDYELIYRKREKAETIVLGASQSAQLELPRADRIVCITVRSDTGAFLPYDNPHATLH